MGNGTNDTFWGDSGFCESKENVYDIFEMQNYNRVSKGINEKRDTDMSFAVGLTTKDGIYLAADKRITKHDGTFDDTYQKIAMIPGTNFAVMSTGDHPIGNTTIKDIIENIKSRDFNGIMGELEENIIKLNFKGNWKTVFFICESLRVDNFDVKNTAFRMILSKIGYPQKVAIHNSNPFEYFYSGESWAVNLMDSFERKNIPLNNPEVYLKSLLESIIKISQECTNTKFIGGGMSILHLTPDGPQWIQK